MIGVNLDHGTCKPHILNALYSLGIRVVRYIVYGQFNNDLTVAVIKGQDDYDFRATIDDLDTIRNTGPGGMYTYANWCNIPAFMSGGIPAYQMYQSWVADPHTPDADLVWAGPDGTRWRLATPVERPYMWLPNIPHVDPVMVESFAEAFAAECSNVIDYAGAGNEWGGRAYWPPVQAPPYEVAYQRAFDEVLAPFARGYRRGSTGGVATLVGPEADVESCFGFLCRLELERGYRVFDVLSDHRYPWSDDYLSGALARSVEFMASARKWASGRPIWSTETIDSSENGQTPELFAESARLYPDLRAQFIFEPWQLFVDAGAGKWLDRRFDFRLSPQGLRFKAMTDDLARRTTKRRAVR